MQVGITEIFEGEQLVCRRISCLVASLTAVIIRALFTGSVSQIYLSIFRASGDG